MSSVIDIRPKLATDALVRLGNDVRALGDLRPVDIRAAKLVYESTGEPLEPLDALNTILGLLTMVRDEVAALESLVAAERGMQPVPVPEPA